MKVCTKCQKRKRLTSFHRVRKDSEKRRSECADCRRRYTLARHHAKKHEPAQIRYSRAYQLKYKFKITEDDYERLLKKQRGKCAICKKPPHDVRGGKILPLSVDHNHKTGRVRGLLCKRCNVAIGMLDDNPKLLARALEYLS